jgi:membrane associated rhomboid family serine protease
MLGLFPYRPDIEIDRIPMVTVAICVLCVLVYVLEYRAQARMMTAAVAHCQVADSPRWRMTLNALTGAASAENCARTMVELHGYPNRAALIAQWNRDAKRIPIAGSAEESARYIERTLNEEYQRYARGLTVLPSTEFGYRIGSYDVLRMFTANIVHGDIPHVAGNVVGFVAFGILVEAIAGSVMFVVLLLVVALSVAGASTLWYLGAALAPVTVGLSGLVYGAMGALAYLWPRARIVCVLWIVVWIQRLTVPAWILAATYVGWDLQRALSALDTRTNLAAHLAGAAGGYLFAWTCLRWRKREIQAVIARRPRRPARHRGP